MVSSMQQGEGLALRTGPRGHWLTPVLALPSAHHDARPLDTDISLVVIHNISLPAGHFGTPLVSGLFGGCLADVTPGTAPPELVRDLDGVRVSAHLLVDRAGAVTQFVPFDRRAWHAGRSSWRGRDACNDFSIGIELEGTDTMPFSDAQYDALADVLIVLIAAYPALSPDSLAGHSDVAPGRKTDPGPAFDWARLGHALARRR